jgi:hydrogenase 3 maturation protease
MSAGPDRGFAATGTAGGQEPSGVRPEDRPASAVSPEVAALLRAQLRGRVAVMGVGNPLRGDDAVGSIVARKLQRAFAWVPPGAPDDGGVTMVAIVDAEEIPESYLDVLCAARPAVVVLVDAADVGRAPGSVVLVDGSRLADHASSTHRTPLAPVARYLEGRTGARVLLAGIQPGPDRWGDGLSGAVEDTANRLSNILWDALRAGRAESPEKAWTPEAPVC